MVFAGADLDPDTLKALSEMGFGNPDAVVDTVRGWLHGRYRATRSERTRGMLTQLAPTILDALARTGDPDGTCTGSTPSCSACPPASSSSPCSTATRTWSH